MTQKQEIQRLKEENRRLLKLYEKAINQLIKLAKKKREINGKINLRKN